MRNDWKLRFDESKKLELLMSGRGNGLLARTMLPLEEEFIQELKKHLRIERYTINWTGVTIRFQNQYCYKFDHEWFEIADKMLPSVEEMAFKAQQMIEKDFLDTCFRVEVDK